MKRRCLSARRGEIMFEKEKFDKDSQWMDRMVIKVIFYFCIVIIVLGILANIGAVVVVIRILQDLGYLR